MSLFSDILMNQMINSIMKIIVSCSLGPTTLEDTTSKSMQIEIAARRHFSQPQTGDCAVPGSNEKLAVNPKIYHKRKTQITVS